MVFQASTKTTSTAAGAADFSALQRVKFAEDKAIKDIQAAEKQAEMIVINAEQAAVQNEKKSIDALRIKLDQEFKVQEQKAKEEAKLIRSHGEAEADKIKSEVQMRIPTAVDQIVKSVIGN